MSKRIEFDRFREYALKLLNDGTKVCPCCLSKRIQFTTDDGHDEFWLECASCHMGVRDHLFSRVHAIWEKRPSGVSKIGQVTYDIECSYYDDGTGTVKYVTMDDPKCENIRCSECEHWKDQNDNWYGTCMDPSSTVYGCRTAGFHCCGRKKAEADGRDMAYRTKSLKRLLEDYAHENGRNDEQDRDATKKAVMAEARARLSDAFIMLDKEPEAVDQVYKQLIEH